ncbi:MAG: hypothetical protein ABR588_05890 [Sphingomicrobium sp.]|nr:hypothetical protein [Sphingomonadales bacterium]
MAWPLNGLCLCPEDTVPGLIEGRQVTGKWLIEQLAEKLDASWDEVVAAFERLPTNSVALLDSPEGMSVVASAVSFMLGRGREPIIVPARH